LPNLNALIGPLICHYLINPLGAIGNGIELLGQRVLQLSLKKRWCPKALKTPPPRLNSCDWPLVLRRKIRPFHAMKF
jgi:hypothetical protein